MSIEERRETDSRSVSRRDALRRLPMATHNGDVTEALTGKGSEEGGERESATPRKSDAKGPFGGLTAAQAQARSAQRRREKKAQQERDAELDKLTVRARLAAVTARELTVPTLADIFRQLIDRALHGSGHVANAAAKLIFELASAVNEDEAEEVEGVRGRR